VKEAHTCDLADHIDTLEKETSFHPLLLTGFMSPLPRVLHRKLMTQSGSRNPPNFVELEGS